MEVKWMIVNCIIVMLTVFISFSCGLIIGLKKRNSNQQDGIVYIEKGERDGIGLLELEWKIESDELIKRKYVVFQVENHTQDSNP